ncbi:MAG: exo-alpha-sialidase [Victivallales bacterium]|nr:exo-alpha-sialidase [Victivallales bacterium]
MLLFGVVLPAWLGAADQPWRVFHENGKWATATTGWIGKGTHSERTDAGLLVRDSSTEKGSGRMYLLNWGAVPKHGAAIEARLRVIACSEAWGVSMLVADGVHEECLTIYPDHLQLVNARVEVPFEAGDGFHTYRLAIKGEDVMLLVDGKLLHDGTGKFLRRAVSDPPRNQCGFGSGASTATGEAVWQWVKYQSDQQAEKAEPPATVDGLTVAFGKTVELVPGAIYQSLFRFRDGRLAVAGQHSDDQGATWHPGPTLSTGFHESEDGTLINLGFRTKMLSPGVFETPLVQSTDGGKTVSRLTARLNIPEGTGGMGDDGKRYGGPLVDHAIVRCRDGSLLATMYGYFKTDTVLCPTFPPEWGLYKYRTFVIRSTDGGRIWDYWATVAYDPKVGLESFCEADLLTLPNGDILCFMRTGGSGGKHTPLHLSVSRDDGKTWEKSRPIADRGVWPSACRMASGVLVVTYGRPDNWLAFSLDDGKTWGGHTRFARGESSNYNSIEEVAPGKLLVVYDERSIGPDGNMGRATVGTFVTVTRN